eukprot:GHRR01011772.1.p1 GENE.GHRR01011772.1~~GHRR01011772.1.p1  ORF type:complete len:147 (-),score=42.54 GHRR01011772.1:2548-2988(-)
MRSDVYCMAHARTDSPIQVAAPGGRPCYLGLKFNHRCDCYTVNALQVLDEPAAVQSDPTLLNLQLRQLSKDTPGVRMDIVGRIDHNDKDKQQRLSAWISSITDIHKHRPTAAVSYSRPMPDIEALMQVGCRDIRHWYRLMAQTSAR